MVFEPPQACSHTGERSGSRRTSTIRIDPGVGASMSPSKAILPSENLRSKVFGSRIILLVQFQVGIHAGVSIELKVEPHYWLPIVLRMAFVPLPVVFRAGVNEPSDVPLVGVEQKADHRTAIVNFAIRRHDDPRLRQGHLRRHERKADQGSKNGQTEVDPSPMDLKAGHGWKSSRASHE